jgi:hypothetical protein
MRTSNLNLLLVAHRFVALYNVKCANVFIQFLLECEDRNVDRDVIYMYIYIYIRIFTRVVYCYHRSLQYISTYRHSSKNTKL